MKRLLLILFLLLFASPALWADETKLYCHKILDQLVREAAQVNYEGSVYVGYHGEHATYHKVLGLKLELGDSHPEYLLGLGFEVATVNGRQEMRPPKNFEDIFMRASSYFKHKIMEATARHTLDNKVENLTDDDVIWPSLVFIKKGVNPQNAKLTDFYLMRYGVDLQPDLKEFELYTQKTEKSLQFPEDVFTGFLVQGKMPLGLDDMLDHELGHLTEFMERPQLMKRIKRAAWLIYGLNIQTKNDHDEEFKRRVKNVSERFFYLMEFMAVPKINNKQLIRQSVSHIFDNPNLDNIFALQDFLKEKPVDEVYDMARELVKNQYKLFYKMGGGHRDAYNSFRDVGKNTFRDESPLVLLLQIRRSMENLSRLGMLAKRTPEYTALIERLSRVQMALYVGLKYQITPEKLYDQMIVLKPSADLDSVKYFNAFSPRSGELYRFFVADN